LLPVHANAAIVFDRTPDGLVVSRITFQKKLWTQLDLDGPGASKTPSQCVELTESAVRQTIAFPPPAERAQGFLDKLAKIN
jgi:hypothetical protein